MQELIVYDLRLGEPKRREGRDVVCFCIVTKEHKCQFVQSIASAFVELGSWYHFYGKDEPLWHREFDEVSIDKKSSSEDEDAVAMTCGYECLDEFTDELYYALNADYDTPTDVYLFYDDEDVYREAMRLLAGEH